VTRQVARYLTLVGIFALSGYLIWLGDDWPLRTVPARYVGYLVAAIGLTGLLGVNIWYGGLLDKRRDLDAAGNTPSKGFSRTRLIVTAIAVAAGSITAVHLFVPIEGANDLKIGKYRITADFPCRPKRHKQVVAKTETGDELSHTSLLCSQGDVTYSLSATEYPEQVLKSLPADALLDRSLESMRSQPQYTFKSSTRQVHQNFPAMRTHLLDSTEPPLDMERLIVVTDAGIVAIGDSWPSGSPEPSQATSFTGSLRIGER
jgi:hypothetical protein